MCRSHQDKNGSGTGHTGMHGVPGMGTLFRVKVNPVGGTIGDVLTQPLCTSRSHIHSYPTYRRR